MKRRILTLILTVAMLIAAIPLVGVTAFAKAAIKTQSEAVTWLNSQNNATYDFDGAYGTQCPEFVRAYVNWLLSGNAWTDCWKRPTLNGNEIWKNSLWAELGWEVYYNTADFLPQPGDIFSAGLDNGNHTGVVISSDLSTAVIADANARNSDWTDGDPVYVHTITWKSASSDTAYGATHFIRPKFASSGTSTVGGIQKKINQIRAVYDTGSYFTAASSTAGCTSNNHDVVNGVWCQGCYLPNIPSRGGLPSGRDVGYQSDTCCGFASYVFYCIYGHNHATNTSKTSSAVFGDLVDTGSHWFIYLSEDSTNYYVYDANGYNGGKNKVIYNNYYPKSSVSSLTVYHASNYDQVSGSVIIEEHTHSYTSSITKNPSCTTSGQRTYTCSCGDSYSETIAATGHKWNSGEIVTAAGCESEGVKKYTCTVCGETYTSAISSAGHTLVKDEAIEATCLTTGLTEGSHCAACGAVIQPQEIVPVLGHDYRLVDIKSSCSSVTSVYKCSQCNDSYEETAYGDVWSDWSETVPDGVPQVNVESKTQYRYSKKDTTQSDASSLEGWTAYDTQITGWTDWSSWSNTSVSASNSREVKTQYISPTYKTVWHYSRSVSSDGKLSSYETSYYPNSQSITLDYQLSYKGSVDGQSRYGSYDGGYGTYLQNYWWNEWSESVVDKAGYTQYSYRDAVYTYHFYKWSEMSQWQDEAITEDDITKVETQTVYRYRVNSTGHMPCDVWSHNSEQHWHECSECNSEFDRSYHVYDNAQDTDCNICGATREIKKPVSENAPKIIIETKRAVIGKTVEVEVSMKNNPGFGGMAYDINYDSAVLELVSYELGIGNSICTDSGIDRYPNKMNFQYAGISNIEGDGVLVSLTFKIRESASLGFTEISITPEDGTFFLYEDRTEVDLTVECSDGGIEIVQYTPGDINGDGKINNRDAARLMQYLAGWDVDINEASLDVNGDGKVNNRDAARISQYLAGWDVELY